MVYYALALALTLPAAAAQPPGRQSFPDRFPARDARVAVSSHSWSGWQVRINAATRAAGLTYSRFIEGLKAAKCALDRKVLADIAATDAAAFGELVTIAKNALKAKPAATLAKA